jgi:hypothetical protein
MIIFLCTMNSTLVKCSPPVARGSSLWILATGRLYNCGCVNIVINTLDVNSIRMTDIFMNDPSFVKYNLCKGWTAYIHTVIVFEGICIEGVSFSWVTKELISFVRYTRWKVDWYNSYAKMIRNDAQILRKPMELFLWVDVFVNMLLKNWNKSNILHQVLM